MRQLSAHEQPRTFVSSLSGPEVFAAIMRKGRAGEASPPVKLTFVSTDEGLLTVTKKLGCSIENPNLHP